MIQSESIIPDGYIMGSYIARRLDLNSNYFNVASKENYDIKAQITKIYGFTYVKLDDEIHNALLNGYICNKIKKEDTKEYDFTVQFSKNCLLGFYK